MKQLVTMTAIFATLVFASEDLAAERKFQPMGRRSIDPTKAANASFISVAGKVTSTTPTAFRLDYGEGSIIVEMDDFDDFAEGRALMENDEVVVFGTIDNEAMERRTIEARRVYIDNLKTEIHASAVDDEERDRISFAQPRVTPGQVVLTGLVTSRTEREIMLNTGDGTIRVDTAGMEQNPLDDEGYLRVDVGDRIKVGGRIDDQFWDEAEMKADWIVEFKKG